MIPFADLKAQYHSIKEEIDRAIAGVLESGQFILGAEVAALEEEFAAFCGTAHGIGVNSGTSALHLALLAAGIGPGDEVITTPFTFAATAAAIYYTGALPVYVDINPVTFNLDPALLEQAITNRTRAILPVHLYGQPADMGPILEIAQRHGKIVIEDAAQAHGAEYGGKRIGGLGDIGCFSFYPGKNLGAYGEGGMVVTNNPKYAKMIRMLRDWGQSGRYCHELRGYNYRMDGLQGAILRVKLRHLERWTNVRRAHASLYGRCLAAAEVSIPVEMSGCRHVYAVYTIRSSARDDLQRRLASSNIQTAIHYPLPVYLQNAYRDERYRAGACPEAERAAREVLSLPLYPELTAEQVEIVSGAVLEHARVVATP